MYSLIWWSVMWRPGKGQFLISVKNLLPIRPAATAGQRAPYGAAPFAGFATSLGLRPPAVTHPASFSSRLTCPAHPVCRAALRAVAAQIDVLRKQVGTIEDRIVDWCRRDAASRRLISIPGVGPITATAIAATVTDPLCFRSGRQLAAWLGLVPRQHSSGGKDRLGGICKHGDRYIRRLLVVGAHAVIRYARNKGAVAAPWINNLLDRRSTLVVAVALANKTARIAWAVLARGEMYHATPSVPV